MSGTSRRRNVGRQPPKDCAISGLGKVGEGCKGLNCRKLRSRYISTSELRGQVGSVLDIMDHTPEREVPMSYPPKIERGILVITCFDSGVSTSGVVTPRGGGGVREAGRFGKL